MKRFPLVFSLLIAAGAANAQQYTISTIAGTPGGPGWYGDGGFAIYADMYFPTGVALDSKGDYFIIDYYNNIIREVSGGIINTVAGNGTPGFQGDNYIANQAELTDVHGIATDTSGNLYIADTSNNRIREVTGVNVTSIGTITTIVGNGTAGYSGDGGAAVNAELNHPWGVAVDSSGNVYIVDRYNYVIRKVSTSGTISTFAGNGILGTGGDGGPANQASFGSPVAIAISPAGNIYVSDTLSQSIREIAPDGSKIQTVVSNVQADSIAVDGAGNIYFTYGFNNSVLNEVAVAAPGGKPVVIAGNGAAGYSGDGGPSNFAQLNIPEGVALDSSGNVYIGDSMNSIVRLLTPVSMGISAIQNAASGIVGVTGIPGAVVAPGEIVAIYGNGLGPAVLTQNQPVGNVYGTQAGGTSVMFDSFSAPVIFASSTLVAAIVPYEEAQGNSAQVTVTYQGQTTLAASAYVYTAPGIFTFSGNGLGQAAAVNQNGTCNGAAAPASGICSPAFAPAPVGSVIALYTTGEGQTAPAGKDGAIAPGPANAQQSVTATVGGLPATVFYAGAAPGEVNGLMQVNVQIPAQVTPGNAVPVVITVAGALGNVSSQTTATIAVSAH